MNITQDDLTTFSIVFQILSRNGVIEPLPQSDKLLEVLALTYPDSKLKVVKAYKFLCDIGLKEAKDAVDNYFMNNQKSLETG
jgi:ribosomal protein L7/L12